MRSIDDRADIVRSHDHIADHASVSRSLVSYFHIGHKNGGAERTFFILMKLHLYYISFLKSYMVKTLFCRHTQKLFIPQYCFTDAGHFHKHFRQTTGKQTV